VKLTDRSGSDVEVGEHLNKNIVLEIPRSQYFQADFPASRPHTPRPISAAMAPLTVAFN
jgi:hypothetical protein